MLDRLAVAAPALRIEVVQLLAMHPGHPANPARGRLPIATCADAAWASGHRGTGLDAVVRTT